MSLPYNKISAISFHAFEYMKQLEHLDLSYNRLESFDNRIFEMNKMIRVLDLSGNKFSSLQNDPIIKNDNLEILMLKDCKLVHVHELMFTEVPNLMSLDISQNHLKVIYKETFLNMGRLHQINLEDNLWNCDKNMKHILKYFKKNNVIYRKNQCCEYFEYLYLSLDP